MESGLRGLGRVVNGPGQEWRPEGSWGAVTQAAWGLGAYPGPEEDVGGAQVSGLVAQDAAGVRPSIWVRNSRWWPGRSNTAGQS